MYLNQLLTTSRVLCQVDVVSKKRALEYAAETLAEQFEDAQIPAETIFQGLLARERLGSTGIGDGIAIPHCRLEECPEAVALLMTLKSPIDFDAVDNAPVDLLCFLLVPQEGAEEHLQTLAGLAEMFSDASTRNQLRDCDNNERLYETAIRLSKHGD